MTNQALLVLVAVSMFAGCATGVRNASLGPGDLAAIETRTYDEDYNVVYAAARKALQDAGYDIATSNRDAGVISTGYRPEKMSDLAHATSLKSRTRASVNVATSDEGTKVSARWFWGYLRFLWRMARQQPQLDSLGLRVAAECLLRPCAPERRGPARTLANC